jgi:saccharopine dehydrogenase (NADP+, L-glutamate forming)
MKTILVLGAGRSSSSLISFLLQHAQSHEWRVRIGDVSESAVMEKIGSNPHGEFIPFDITDDVRSERAVQESDVVISLLPAHFHPRVAQHCLRFGKHLLTASYVSAEMSALHREAFDKGLLFLNECGLDPGIDHMSAMQVIDRIRKSGGNLYSFESFTGGLIAPETDLSNPWRYKFTWNPRNVVMAGQGTAKYLENGSYKYIPYQQLFKRTTEVEVAGYGSYDGYANRDSLQYIDTYQLHGIKTMIRGTLRNKGYCDAWHILVQLGCCDDTYAMDGVGEMTHKSFISAFVDESDGFDVQQNLVRQFNLDPNGEEMKRLKWSGFFTDEPVGLAHGTPARILEHILQKRWKLQPEDKDLIVMWHRFAVDVDGKRREIQASLVARGENATFTAMAKTVGLPLAIAAKLLLENKIQSRGVVIPTIPEIYEPVLKELSMLGIELHEKEIP